MKIITHDGTFHSDEVFAIALLKKFTNLSNTEIIRTRDRKVLEEAKKDKDCYVIDVGEEYNEKYKNFDHHQKSFSVTWEEPDEENNMILLSSCGLIWHYLKKKGYLKKLSDNVIKRIENLLIKKIDKHDNGIKKWQLCNMVSMCNREENTIEDFNQGVDLAKIYLNNLIYQEKLNDEKYKLFEKDFEKYDNSQIFKSSNAIKDNRVLNFLSNETNILVMIYPQKDSDNNISWYAKSIHKYDNNHNLKNALAPDKYRGLPKEKLKTISGYKQINFVHRAGFLCGANNEKTIIKIAKEMVDNYNK
tara:strand:- start:72918 stop:73826 length:909 start_codon:yes stop_codon:yes gene_type:complete